MIGDALDSVYANQWSNLEITVVDGGSTDDTRAVLQRYPEVRFIQADGSGVYTALNEGIRASSGEFICLLNTDDLIPPGAFAAGASEFARRAQLEAVLGSERYFLADQDGIFRPDETMRRGAPGDMGPSQVAGGVVAINAMLVRRSAYERIGYFSHDLPLAADREWLLRALANNLELGLTDACTYVYRRHPGSLTMDPARRRKEQLRLDAISIARRVLHDQSAPMEFRRICADWHARDTGLLLIGRLKQMRLKGSPDLINEAFRTDRVWPARFLAQTPSRLLQRILR